MLGCVVSKYRGKQVQETTLSRVHKVVYFVTTVSEVFCLFKYMFKRMQDKKNWSIIILDCQPL
jgi:flagellar biosynthesis protein FliQ